MKQKVEEVPRVYLCMHLAPYGNGYTSVETSPELHGEKELDDYLAKECKDPVPQDIFVMEGWLVKTSQYNKEKHFKLQNDKPA